MDPDSQSARSTIDSDASEDEYPSIFALRGPSKVHPSTAHSWPEPAGKEKAIPAGKSDDFSASALTRSGTNAAAESRTSVTLSRRPGDPGEPAEEIRESDIEDSCGRSDINSDTTETSLIKALEASAGPFSSQLLSVLVSVEEEIVHRSRLRLQSMIARPHGARQHPVGPPYGSGSSIPGFPPGNRSSAHRHGASRNSRQQPVDDDDGHNSGTDDGDDDGERNMQGSTSSLGARPQGRFACPFLKRYPESKKLTRACCGPGWESVHRMK